MPSGRSGSPSLTELGLEEGTGGSRAGAFGQRETIDTCQKRAEWQDTIHQAEVQLHSELVAYSGDVRWLLPPLTLCHGCCHGY